jgi:5-methylcytosine-specific restriction enzyme subunit McrC
LAGTSETKRRITGLLHYFANVSRWSLNERDLERVVLNRTVERYAYVWEQAKVFLRGLSPDVLSGGFRSYALLFDMNVLFEEFISQQLATPAHRMGYTLYTQRPQKRLLSAAVSGESHFVMKPDLTLMRDGAVVAVVDTKWKVLTTDAKMGISQSDLYQLYTYSGEYDAKDAILVYPANPPDIVPGVREFCFAGCGRGLWTWAVDLGAITRGNRGLQRELERMLDELSIADIP